MRDTRQGLIIRSRLQQFFRNQKKTHSKADAQRRRADPSRTETIDNTDKRSEI